MKNPTIAAVRVEAELDATVECAPDQSNFMARGLRSRESAWRSGEYVSADAVLANLQRKLSGARERVGRQRE